MLLTMSPKKESFCENGWLILRLGIALPLLEGIMESPFKLESRFLANQDFIGPRISSCSKFCDGSGGVEF